MGLPLLALTTQRWWFPPDNVEIIIRGRTPFGKSRSEREENLRKEWGQTMTDDQLDKVKWLEKKVKEANGSETTHVHPIDADKVK